MYKFDQTAREVFESTLKAALSSGDISELKSTQDIDKYADFIVTAIRTAVDKAIPTSKSGGPESQPVSDETLALINLFCTGSGLQLYWTEGKAPKVNSATWCLTTMKLGRNTV